jgi:outer membrane receptor protein involved in Fe transport
MAYLVRYRFGLYSNFTFFRDDPVNGDQIEQTDNRTFGGVDVRLRRHFDYRGATFTTSVGAQMRVDGIDNGLFHDRARERLETRVSANVAESQLGVYVEEDARVRKWLRFVVGARVQRIDVSVDDHIENTSTQGNVSSGVKGAMLFLPKCMAAVSPIPQVDLYASYGRGFHSNDARGVVRARDAAMLVTPANGYEVGVRATPIPGMSLTAAGFWLDLASELVWVGDEGTNEASRQTRRYGLELGARYRIKNWLFADVDATFTRARFRGTGGAVPLAPTRTFAAGLSARPTFGNFIPFAAVRIKAIADRPATEDESLVAEGFTIVDANAGLRWKNMELAVDAQNVLNSTWREVQFATESRLPYEPTPVTGIHYTPGWPRTVMGRATVYWK